MSEGTALVSEDTALVSEDTALVSEDTALVSEDTALVSGDTALVSEGTALVSEDTALVSVQSALVSVGHSSGVGGHNSRVVGHNSRVGEHSSRFKLKPGDLNEQVCKLARNDPNFPKRRIKASFRKRCNPLSGLQVGEKAIQTFLCGGSMLPFGSGAIPFRVCKLAKRRSKRFCAEDRSFLSEAKQFPFGKTFGVHRECNFHGNMRVPAWAPLGLLSSALLFMTCTKNANLGTCWSSQENSAVHNMARMPA